MYKKAAIAGVIIGLTTTPFFASAVSVEELQAQIRDLLAKVAQLQAQLQTGVQSSPMTVSPAEPTRVSATARICSLPFARSLSFGARGDEVLHLQEFLRSEGLLEVEPTGYFGAATRAALGAWQMNSSIVSAPNAGIGWGVVGPKTREAIKAWCLGPKTQFRANPAAGNAPLTVTFTAHVTLANPQFVADAGQYKIVFGDGSEYILPCTEAGMCAGPHTATHTYTADGYYSAQLVHYGYFGPADEGNQRVIATTDVRVGSGPIACTKEYRPVCGAKQVQCITTPCNPIPTTYGNRCEMNADGATFLYEGACRDTSGDPAANPQCRSWYDGCNSCSREYPGGPAMCTLRACTPESMTKPYCTATFDGSENKPPVISGFSGPTTLAVNERGTWSVTASDPENGRLSYSIVWGDEWYVGDNKAMFPTSASIVQQTSFTHSFSRAGTYTVRMSVSDDAGKTAEATATVTVGQTACAEIYEPVCGRPQGCANTCPPGMYCALVCRLHTPITYSNTCELNNANASFVHAGACTTADR